MSYPLGLDQVSAAQPEAASPRLRRLLGFTTATLWLEAAWSRGLATGAAAFALYVIAGAAGWTAALPGAARLALFAAALAAFAAGAVRAARRTPRPTPAAARARLETASRLPHGLLAPLIETPAHPLASPGGALWGRALITARTARLSPPLPRLARPLGPSLLAAAGAATALVALIAAPGPLRAAFSPYLVNLTHAEASLLIEPPAYTSRDARRLTLRLGDARQTPALAGSRILPAGFTPDGPWRIERSGPAVLVRHGSRTFARLVLVTLPDQPPRPAWAGTPAAGGSGAIALPYRLADDFDNLSLALEIADGDLRRTVPLAAGLSPGPGRAVADLSADPAAGRPVLLTLVARDAAGQTGRSPAVRAVLPARAFTDRLARAIIHVRAQLLQAPGVRAPVIDNLDALSSDAAAAGPPAATFPALRSAAYRLAFDPRASAVPETAQTLWEAAVARDNPAATSDGGLQAALNRLAAALAAGNDGAAQSAAAELEQALARHLQSIGRQQGRPGQPGPGASIEASQLAGMAREIAERQAAGDTAGARALLAALREALNGLRLASPGRPGAAPAPPGFDPLGRAGFGSGRIQVIDPARARDLERIRATLRARAADPERPGPERDYYKRLIDRF